MTAGGDKPWLETDSPGPLSVYGRTKLEGEEAILASGCDYLIFRTSWVHAARGSNFVRTMLNLAKERDRIRVIDDQIGTPTGAELIADVTSHAIRAARMRHEGHEASGLYHLVAGGETSWYGFALFVIDRARRAGIKFKTPDDAIDPVHSSDSPFKAERPNNSRLDTTKIRATFSVNLPQ